MKYLLAMLLLLACIACSKNESNVATVINTHMYIHLQDSNGLDLLDPATPGRIDTSKIRTFHLVNGKKVEVLNPRADAPRGFVLCQPNTDYTKYYIKIFLSKYVDADSCSETYVQWSDTDTDTIRSYYDIKPNYFVSKKKWYNGVLKEDQYNGLRSGVYDIVK